MNSEPAFRTLRHVAEGVVGELLLLLCFLPAVARGQIVSDLRIGAADQAQISVNPGNIATMAVSLDCTTGEEIRCLSMINLPRGWRLLMGEEAFDVRPGTHEIRLFSFAVPRDAESGSYQAEYVLQTAETGIEISRVRFVISVLPSLQLDLALISAPRDVVAGESYHVRFAVTNRGNEAGKIRLRIRSIPELPDSSGPTTFLLAAGESRDVNISVHTDENTSLKFRHALELKAWLTEDSTVTSTVSSLVTVLPRATFTGEQFRIPLQVSFRNAGENGESGSQAELYSSGSFSPAGRDAYELLLRGPDNRTSSFLGERDEYRIGYESENADLIAGDQVFRLTPLTELGRYAFGASSRLRFDRVNAGIFLNEARWSPARAKQAGGFASYHVAPDASVGINYLHKNDAGKNDVVTLLGQFPVLDGADIAMEAGRSSAAGGPGNGLTLQVHSRPARLRYDLTFIHAEPGFGGYYRDFDAKALSLSYLPVGRLRVEGYFRDERRNLAKDPLQLHAPQNRIAQVGLGFENYIGAYFRLTRQRDLLPAPKYDQEDRALLLRLGAIYRSGSLFADIDVGRTEELLLHRSFPRRRFSLTARFQPDHDQNYSTSVEYVSTKDLFTELPREGASWSIQAWYRISRSLQFHFGLYESWTIAPSRQNNTLADAGFEYLLPFGHRIIATGRINQITSVLDRENTAYSVEYVIPLSFTVSKSSDGGSISGRVIDLESGVGISDIVVYAGEYVAVTDEEGRFEFSHLRDGTYPVSVDRGAIGPDRISAQVLPMDVPLSHDVDRYLEIAITISCSITGEVTAVPEGEIDAASARMGLRGVTVEVKSGSEILRRMTDSRGHFGFSDLRPGTWMIRVLEENLPPDLRAEMKETLIDLKPGERKETNIGLLPLERRIRILQEGLLIRPSGG